MDCALAIQHALDEQDTVACEKLREFRLALAQAIDNEKSQTLLIEGNLDCIGQTAYNFDLSLLYIAALKNQIVLVKKLLVHAHTDVNHKSGGVAALSIAAQFGHTVIVKLLIAHGAAVDITITAKTAVLLRQASLINRQAALESLLTDKYGSIPVTLPDFTPLHEGNVLASGVTASPKTVAELRKVSKKGVALSRPKKPRKSGRKESTPMIITFGCFDVPILSSGVGEDGLTR